MRLLLDTHILLWSIYQPRRLTAATRSLLTDPANDILFSAVSIAEVAIKSSLGRSDFPFQPGEVAEAARMTGFAELTLDSRQAMRLADMPWHHRDPFDRLLVAQSIEEGLRLLTTDRRLASYSDLVEEIAVS